MSNTIKIYNEMDVTSNLLKEIEEKIQSIPYPQYPEGLYEPIQYVLAAGGKRIRPMLTLLGYNLYREDVNNALPVALAIELYHNHTLLHDDLMDSADMRRGRPTVHKKWDENTAILSGDTMLIMSVRLLLSMNCVRKEELLELVVRTMNEVCEGQQYDVNFENRDNVSEEEYIEMIRLKTSVLLACSLKAGAIAANAPNGDCKILYDFAERIGLAFQLQDDFLDVYGDPAIFGKNIGGDILCGKKTYLLIKALTQASELEKKQLLAYLYDKEMDAQIKIKEVTHLYNKLGVPVMCQDKINSLYAEASELLAALSLPNTKKELLWQYLSSLLGRKS